MSVLTSNTNEFLRKIQKDKSVMKQYSKKIKILNFYNNWTKTGLFGVNVYSKTLNCQIWISNHQKDGTKTFKL